MPRELELFDGTLLEFPDETPDDVMLAAGRRETQRLRDAAARRPLPRDVTPSPGGRGDAGATAEQAVQRAPLPSPMQRIAEVDRGIRQAAADRQARLTQPEPPAVQSVFDATQPPSVPAVPPEQRMSDAEYAALVEPGLSARQRFERSAQNPGSVQPSDPRNAVGDALRGFDRKPIDRSTSGYAKEVVGDALRGVAKVFPGLGSAAWGVVQAAADVADSDKIADFASDANQAGQRLLASFDNPNGDKLVSGAFQSLGTAAVTGATGGTIAAIGAMVGQTAGDQYALLRRSGFTVEESIEGASVHGVAEFIGERIGMPGLARLVGGMASRTGMRPAAVLKEALKQQGEEQVTLAIQNLYDKTGRAGTRPDMTLDEYIDDAVQTAAQTVIMTASAGGGGAAARALSSIERRKAAVARLDDMAAEFGIPSKAVKAIKEQSERVPINDAPGFMKRAIAALRNRGVVGPQATDDALAALDEQPPSPATSSNPYLVPRETLQPPQELLATIEDLAGMQDDGTGLADMPPRTPIDDAAHDAATSPENDLSEPTEGQKQAGNYKVGRARIAGMDISIENPEGSVRRGVDPDGNPWETTMRAHYGYVRGSEAKDGDHVDVFIKPGTPPEYAGPVFVVDQIDPRTGKYDEAKAIIGAADQAEAEAIYRSNYADDWRGLGAITSMPINAFKAWASSKEARKPLGILNGGIAARTAGDGIARSADAGRSAGSELLRDDARRLADDAGIADEQGVRGEGVDGIRPGQPVSNNALSAAPPAAPQRIIARAGRTPNATTDVELRTNDSGTVTPYMEGKPLLDYDSGQPIELDAGVSDLDAKKAIRAAGAVGNKTNFYPPKNAAAQAEGEGARAGASEPAVSRVSAPVAAAPSVAASAAPPTSAAVITSQGAADEKGQSPSQEAGQDRQAQAVLSGSAADRAKSVAPKAHPHTVMGSRLLAVLSKDLRGLSPSLIADLSHRFETKRIGKNGRRVTQWRNPMIPGIGKLFRAGGSSDFTEMAETLEARGYLPPGTVESGSYEFKVQSIIQDALNRVEAKTQDEELADAEAAAEAEREHYQALDAEAAAEAEAERAAIMAENDLTAADMQAVDDDDIAFDWPPTSKEALREIAQAADDAAAQEGADEARQDAGEGSDAPAQARSAAAQPDAQEGLTAPTAESLRADAERASAADKADRAEQKRLADKARADAERDEFTLTGSDRAADVEAAAGQRGMFDEPTADARQLGREAGQRGDPRDPPQDLSNTDKQLWRAGWDQSKQTKVTPQVAPRAPRTANTEKLIALRKRASVLQSLLDCLTS
jgi:hypothetical protein